MSWFAQLTGFDEQSYAHTQSRLVVTGRELRSQVSKRSYSIGTLDTPSVAELRTLALAAIGQQRGTLGVSSLVADVSALHRDPTNRNAVFQVASQFNLLEMTGPEVTPEHGVTRYAHDRTQGPACAIAAGAATIYRNYLVPVNGAPGQTRHRQIDCLREIGDSLGNTDGALWTMRNGYALCTRDGLKVIDERLARMTEDERNELRARLRVGVHEDVQVTISDDPDQLVSQVFCSALPVAYTSVATARWRAFATLVLEGAYEATLWAGVLNAARTGCRRVLLTSVGGGVFGNDPAWISGAMRRALELVRNVDLDVRIVSYGSVRPEVRSLVREFA